MKRKFLVSFVVGILCVLLVLGFAACSSGDTGRKTITGSYHIEQPINDVKRGVDVTVILNSDNSIYSISIEEDEEYTCSVGGPWGVFRDLNFVASLMSVSVADINGYKVVCDGNGLPTAIQNFPPEWIVVANTDACGMVILALQDAFTKI